MNTVSPVCIICSQANQITAEKLRVTPFSHFRVRESEEHARVTIIYLLTAPRDHKFDQFGLNHHHLRIMNHHRLHSQHSLDAARLPVSTELYNHYLSIAMDEYMKQRAASSMGLLYHTPRALQLQPSSRILEASATATTTHTVDDSGLKLLATNALNNYRIGMVLPRMVSVNSSVASSLPSQHQRLLTVAAVHPTVSKAEPPALEGDDNKTNRNGISISYFSPNATKTDTERTRGAFPRKLHEMLANPEYNECITWMPDGKAWKVLDSAKLESEVLNKFFKHSKYTSFNRQVRRMSWFLMLVS